MTSILVGTPCYHGAVSMEYTASMLGLQRELNRDGVDFSLEMTGSVSLIPIARNYIVAKVLAQPRFTHLLFIDADVGFDPSVVPRYLRTDKDVVAGIYPLKQLDLEAVRNLPRERPAAGALHYAVKTSAGARATTDGFIKADYAATGFMLVKRRVLERMAAHYSDLKYRHSFTLAAAADSAHLYALFDTSLDASGVYLPEDYTFCTRWRALGGEIWVDTRSQFNHVGRYVFAGDYPAARGQGA
jgi:hypothetical protein